MMLFTATLTIAYQSCGEFAVITATCLSSIAAHAKELTKQVVRILLECISVGQVCLEKTSVLDLIFQSKNFPKDNCLFFTDSVGDVLEVSQVLDRSKIYGVTCGFSTRQQLQQCLPDDHIIDDFHQVLDITS